MHLPLIDEIGVTAGDSGLRARVERALERGDRSVRRLSSAGTSVNLRCPERPGDSVTLLLDRDPPEIAGGDEPAEIVIELTARQADLFVAGELVLPTEIAAGRVAYHGPVRKFMAVAPVLRHLLAQG